MSLVYPSISIITPSFNQGPYIEQTIQSVCAQNYPHVEHLVIDGGSTDNTVEILKQHSHLIWISEKDRGQADALNKGLAKSTGDIIGWINSDDFYEENIFLSVAESFQDPATMWVIGNLTYLFDQSGEMVCDKSPQITLDRLVRNPDIVRQLPTFFRKDFLEQAGRWSPEYFMAMDFELWVRLAKLTPPKMINRNFAYFRIHALQKTSIANTRRQTKEIIQILEREQVPWRILVFFRLKKLKYAMKGYIKTFLVKHGLLSSKYLHRPIRARSGT
jgi:glycosyltransferase involved in cell wall biosynthesis